WLVDDRSSREIAALDEQDRTRRSFRLSTIGVLPAPSNDVAAWGRDVTPALARYNRIERWEVANDPVFARRNWDAVAREVRAVRSEVALNLPLWSLPPDANVPLWDGVSLDLPRLDEAGDACGVENSAATLRTLLSARSSRGAKSTTEFWTHLAPDACDPLVSARALVSAATTALAGGATQVDLPLIPLELESRNLAAMQRNAARAAAFSTLAQMLQNVELRESLFPASPTLRGVSFAGKRGQVGVIWAERNFNSRARLVLPLAEARVFDMWGNPVGQTRNGRLIVPLGNGPVYVTGKTRETTWRRAWQNAGLEGLRPLAAQILPLTQLPGSARDALRVRLQNIAIAPMSGVLRIAPPPGWSLAENELPFRLQAGESRVFAFPVAMSAPSSDNLYVVRAVAQRGESRWEWKQTMRTATAENVRENAIEIDGELGEWQRATWMEIGGAKAPVAARLAVRWDEKRLYFAAEVEEPRLQSRRDESEYRFWEGDALQLVFGLRDEPGVKPQRGPFRDTDYGFLLSPFGISADGVVTGRVLRLWNNTLPFDGVNGTVRDRVRWGGAVPASRCAITRDERRK
ncbi:MAG TPA: hypothetical protein VF719_05840, partial [Abditibacteriaceae bacterium]